MMGVVLLITIRSGIGHVLGQFVRLDPNDVDPKGWGRSSTFLCIDALTLHPARYRFDFFWCLNYTESVPGTRRQRLFLFVMLTWDAECAL